MNKNYLTINKAKIKRYLYAFGIIFLLSWVWHYFAEYRPWDIRIPVINKANVPDYEFKNIEMNEIAGKVKHFSIKAASLAIDSNQGKMLEVNGNIFNNNYVVFVFNSNSGVFNFNKKRFVMSPFSGFSKGSKTSGWNINSNTATWDQFSRTLSLDNNPVLKKLDFVVTSKKIVYFADYQYFMLGPNCQIDNGDYSIACDKAALKDNAGVISLEDNVSLKGSDFTAGSNLLDIDYMNKLYSLKGNAFVNFDEAQLSAEEITLNIVTDVINLHNKIVLTKGNTQVKSDTAIIKRKEKMIEFNGNVQATKEGSAVQTTSLVYDLNKNEFVLSGGRTRLTKTDND